MAARRRRRSWLRLAVCAAAIAGPSSSLAQEVASDPYAPVGLRAGTFTIYPELAQGVGYSDNIANRPEPTESGLITQTDARLRGISNWERNALGFDLRGSFTAAPDDRSQDQSSFNGDLFGRLDVGPRTAVSLRAGYELSTEDRVDDQIYRGSAALSQQFNRLTATVRGSFERRDFDDGPRNLSSALSTAVSDYDLWRGSLRLAYDITDRTAVFAEAGVNRREFRKSIDAFGIERGSDGYSALLGLSFARNGKLSGEVSAGYQLQDPNDARFAEVKAWLFDGNVTWRATSLTDIGLNASTEVGETTLAGSGGVVTRQLGASVTHRLLTNVALRADASYRRSEFDDVTLEEETWRGAFNVDYLLSREVALTTGYRYVKFESTAVGADYETNIVSVGVRLQR